MKNQFNRLRSHTQHGVEYTFQLNGRTSIKVVNESRFTEFLNWGATLHLCEQGLSLAQYTDTGGNCVIVLKNSKKLVSDGIDRDSVWHNRLALANILPVLLNGKVELSQFELHHDLPLAIVTAANLFAFGPNANDEDVLRAFFANSQHRFDKTIAAIFSGDLNYDSRGYTESGSDHAAYSHILHFSWLYASQIRLVEQAMNEFPDQEIHVVDLGTGGGHFLLSLQHHMRKIGKVSRLKLTGIDRSDHDARFARDLAIEPIEMLTGPDYDLTNLSFADTLRLLRPTVVVCNHVLEHLPSDGDVKNRYLQDWLLAPDYALSVSVPLGDEMGKTVSDHVIGFQADGGDEHVPLCLSVEKLARDMELRTAYAVEAQAIEETKYAGLFQLVKTKETCCVFNAACVLTVEPHGLAELDPILREDFDLPFDPSRFAIVRKAQKIGQLCDEKAFSLQGQSPRQVRQLVIKMPCSEVRVPTEFAQFTEAIKMVLVHNSQTNKNFNQSFVFLNVFRGETKFSSSTKSHLSELT